jgi:thioredoxin 1
LTTSYYAVFSRIKETILKVLFLGVCLSLIASTCLAQQLPRLVDVGADKCIPCIKMAPILDQLREDFVGKLEVKFVDAWKSRDEAANYKVQMIPTQIFYAADGKELYRHTGFYGLEDILGKWRELGYEFVPAK